METDYDVIVVGAGGAGLAAAYTALENGARVLLAEVGDQVGGSTNLSGSHIHAAGTSVQRAAGVTGDTPEEAFRYYMTLNQYKADPALLARYYPEAAAHGDWTWYIGTPHAQGDGLELGACAGADWTGLNRGLVLATPGFRKELVGSRHRGQALKLAVCHEPPRPGRAGIAPRPRTCDKNIT